MSSFAPCLNGTKGFLQPDFCLWSLWFCRLFCSSSICAWMGSLKLHHLSGFLSEIRKLSQNNIFIFNVCEEFSPCLRKHWCFMNKVVKCQNEFYDRQYLAESFVSKPIFRLGRRVGCFWMCPCLSSVIFTYIWGSDSRCEHWQIGCNLIFF